MKWRKPSNHASDCYFCSINIRGYYRKNKKSITYSSVALLTFPVFIDIESTDNSDIEMQDISVDTSQDEEMETEDILSSSEDEVNQAPSKFTQEELSDLCRDLGLSKEDSELLASRLRDKKCLASGTKVTVLPYRTYYRTRDKPFRKYPILKRSCCYVHCCTLL